MRCHVCCGLGSVLHREEWIEEPCPECQGSGIIHCCEGLQEQPPVKTKPLPKPQQQPKPIQLSFNFNLKKKKENKKDHD